MRLSPIEVRPSEADYSRVKSEDDLDVLFPSFDDIRRATYAYWQREQRLASRFDKPKEVNIIVSTLKDPEQPDNLITLIHTTGPKGIKVGFKEEYDSETRQRPGFTDSCVLSGTIYAFAIQALAPEGFNSRITYIDSSGAIAVPYGAAVIKDIINNLQEQGIKPLGEAAKVLEKLTQDPQPQSPSQQ